MKDRFFTILRKVQEQWRDPYYQGKPAELSFYFMMSIIPTLLLLVQLLASVSITSKNLQEIFGEYFSGKGLSLLQGFLDISNADGYNVLFFLLALWGASKAQFALMSMSNYAYTGNPRVNGYLPERLRAVKNSLLMLFSLMFGLILLVYGNAIVQAVFFLLDNQVIQALNQMFGQYLAVVWVSLRWLLGFLFYNVAVIYVLYNAPTKKLRLRQVLPGSLVTSIGMMLVTAIYSVYTNSTMSDSGFMMTLYGSFSSVIALLVWFFLLGCVLVLGILINAALQFLGIDKSNGDDSVHIQRLS